MSTKKLITLSVIIGAVITGGLWKYLQSPPQSSTQAPVIAKQVEIVQTETVECGGETYIFDLALVENRTYFNEIYKSSRSIKNLLVREKASGIDGFGPKRILAVPQKNCDRIFLTRFTPESDAWAGIGIYEWQAGGIEIRELSISKEFRGDYVSSYPNDWRKDVVSPDGEKVIVAQPPDNEYEKQLQEWWCGLKSMRLLKLKEDVSEILVQLLKNEILDNGRSMTGNCSGVDIGWVDNSTIYYVVYDVDGDQVSFSERRTLNID